MASPNIAGIAALLLEQDKNPYTELIEIATKDTLTGDLGSGSPNNFAFNGFMAAPTPAPTEPSCSDMQRRFRLELNLDEYGSETTWAVSNCDGEVVMSGGPYTDGDSATQVKDACLAHQGYTLTVSDAFGGKFLFLFLVFVCCPPGSSDNFALLLATDGMCCGYGDGSYVASYDGVEFARGGEFETSQSNPFGPCCLESQARNDGICKDRRRTLVRECQWNGPVLRTFSCSLLNIANSPCGAWVPTSLVCNGCNRKNESDRCCLCEEDNGGLDPFSRAAPEDAGNPFN